MTTTTLSPFRTCHVCGLPSRACSGPGFITKITVRAENKFGRDRHISVWCCSRKCAIQANALAELGSATYKWQITLAEFTAQREALLDIREAGSDRTETVAETRVNTGAPEAENEVLDPEASEVVPVREIAPRRGGRPKKWASEADRLRAYRGRRQEGPSDAVQSPSAATPVSDITQETAV